MDNLPTIRIEIDNSNNFTTEHAELLQALFLYVDKREQSAYLTADIQTIVDFMYYYNKIQNNTTNMTPIHSMFSNLNAEIVDCKETLGYTPTKLFRYHNVKDYYFDEAKQIWVIVRGGGEQKLRNLLKKL